MAKVGSYGAGPQGANPDDEATPINKDKFKEQLKKVDAVEKTDPDQKSKKRKPGKEEDDTEQALQALQVPQHPPLGAHEGLGSENQSSSPKVSQAQSPSTNPNPSPSYTPQGSPVSQGPSENNGNEGPSIPQEMDFDDLDFNDMNNPQNPSSTNSSSTDSSSQSNNLKQPTQAQANSPQAKTDLHTKKILAPKHPTQDHQKLKPALAHPKNPKDLKPVLEKQKVEPLSSHDTKKNLSQDKLTTPEKTAPEETSLKKVTKKSLPDEPTKAPLDDKKQTRLQEDFAPSTKKEKEKKEHKIQEIDSSSSATLSMSSLPIPINAPPPAPIAQAQASYLSPAVHELFQTMVGLVMVKQIINEGGPASLMEIALNNPEYANSKFFGLTIKITEFKSAPGVYNIELVGSSAQTQLLEAEKIKLISALNDNRYSLPFTVNRLDVSLKKEDKDFLFKRKESVKGDNKDANHN